MLSPKTLDFINGPGAADMLKKLRDERAAAAAGKQAIKLSMSADAATDQGVLKPSDAQKISNEVHSGQVPVVDASEL